ncbi:MAG TPA: carboxypeptidase-like regulatory domain-containing protein [Longimicrobium sp.]|nr:carboxypeptidase-like regulatory domain-containing protein [Longimicrobium sp.]
MRTRLLATATGWMLAVLMLIAAPAAAQTVAGRVVEAETGQPVPGAVVVLATPAGTRHAVALADAEGRYTLRARAAGDYTVRAERVGFASSAPSPVRLDAGQTVQLEVRAASVRITLEPVVARGRRRRCSEELAGGAQTSGVWDEARKALQSAALVERTGAYTFEMQIRQRRLTAGGGRVIREQKWMDEATGTPFVTLSGEALERNGYVVVDADSLILYGLGAGAILSDVFLASDCFGVRDGGSEHPGWVGLEFTPLAGRVSPDVRGVLWLDRASSELRVVEYGYTGLPMRGPVDQLGGRLEFQRMASGAWIVMRWHVRGPVLLADHGVLRSMADLNRFTVAALLETGGEVVAVRPTPVADMALRR